MSLNKVSLIGYVGQDPEIRSTQNGTRVANFSLATSESYKDRTTEEKREKTQWHRIVIWNDVFIGLVEKYVKKGSGIYIEGALEYRKWQDQSGNEKVTSEVVLNSYRGELKLLTDSAKSPQETDHKPSHGGSGPLSVGKSAASRSQRPLDMDDEIPF